MRPISRRAILAQIGVVSTFVACERRSTTAEAPQDRARGAKIEGLRLTAGVARQTPKSLELEWTLVNDSPVRVVVLRYLYRAFDASGLLLVEPNLAYVSVSADGAVDISKKLLRAPEGGIQVFTPFVALGEELAAGGRLSETISLDLPLRPWDPYDELLHQASARRPMSRIQSKTLRLHLGVYRSNPGSPSTSVETARGKLIYPDYIPVIEAQTVLHAPPVPWLADAVFGG